MSIIKWLLTLISFAAVILLFLVNAVKPDNEKQIHTKTYSNFSANVYSIEEENQYAILEATVSAHTNIQDFSYEWILPENVNLIEGFDSGEIKQNTKKEYIFKIVIDWSKWNKNNKILFHVAKNNIGKTAMWYPGKIKKQKKISPKAVSFFKNSRTKKIKNKLPDGIKVIQ